jgi:hypothetical protein
LTLTSVVLGAAGALAGLAGNAIAAAVGVFGALAAGVGQIYVTESALSEAAARRSEAMHELAAAARRFQQHVAGKPPFGGTSVLEEATQVDLTRLAGHIREGRFSFTHGQRQYHWEMLADALRDGAREFLASAGVIADIPSAELASARALADVGNRAARRAYAVASAYAGFDVSDGHAGGKYRGPDGAVDLGGLAAYHDLGKDLAELAQGLTRFIAFAPDTTMAVVD